MSRDITTKVIMGMDVSQFRKGVQSVDSSLRGMSKRFQNLGGLIGATFAVSQIQQFLSVSTDLALQAQGIEVAFERIGNEANMIELRKQVQGTVSDLELMRQAVTAEKLGIPIQDMAKMLGFAKKQANDMGKSVDYMVESIVTGVGRKSTLILDNLGILASEVREELKQGGTFAEAVGRIIDDRMGSANNTLTTTRDRLLQQKAALENIQKEIGEKLLPAYEMALNWLNGALSAINTLFSDQLTLVKRISYLASYFNLASGSLIRMQIELEDAALKANQLGLEAPKIGEGFATATDEVKKLGNELRKISGIKVQGGLTLSQAEPGLEQKGPGAIPLYQVDQAVFGIRRVGEFAKGSFEKVNEELTKTLVKIEEFKMSQQDLNSILQVTGQMGAQIGQIMTASFNAAMNNGENFFDSLKDGLRNYAQQMAVATAATLGLAAALSIIFPKIGFNALFKSIGGGMGLPFASLLSGDMTGAVVKGSDLFIAVERNTTNNSRIGG